MGFLKTVSVLNQFRKKNCIRKKTFILSTIKYRERTLKFLNRNKQTISTIKDIENSKIAKYPNTKKQIVQLFHVAILNFSLNSLIDIIILKISPTV